MTDRRTDGQTDGHPESIGPNFVELGPNNSQVKSQVYTSPHLEYACSVWDPYKKCDIDKVEAVQRKVARYTLKA